MFTRNSFFGWFLKSLIGVLAGTFVVLALVAFGRSWSWEGEPSWDWETYGSMVSWVFGDIPSFLMLTGVVVISGLVIYGLYKLAQRGNAALMVVIVLVAAVLGWLAGSFGWISFAWLGFNFLPFLVVAGVTALIALVLYLKHRTS